jgi:hypothetical protein
MEEGKEREMPFVVAWTNEREPHREHHKPTLESVWSP